MKLPRIVLAMALAFPLSLAIQVMAHLLIPTTAPNQLFAQSRLVNRVQDVVCDSQQGTPIVLVRHSSGDAGWSVQSPCRRLDGNRYVSTVRFGDERTPPGTRFQLAVLSVNGLMGSNRNGLALPSEGTIFKCLPHSLSGSQLIEIARR